MMALKKTPDRRSVKPFLNALKSDVRMELVCLHQQSGFYYVLFFTDHAGY